jgi:hypothetical protein
MTVYPTELPFWKRLSLPKMLHSRQIRWRTAFTYAIAILLVLIGLVYVLTRQLNTLYTKQIYTQLIAQARVTADLEVLHTTWRDQPATLPVLLQRWGATLDAHITLFTPEGVALADSQSSDLPTDNPNNLPELRGALATGFGQSVRNNFFANVRTLYVALPVASADSQLGLLRMGFPLTALDQDLQRLRQPLSRPSVPRPRCAA